MIPTLSKSASFLAALMLLSGVGSTPVQADEPTVVEQTEAGDTLSTLLKNILGDTQMNFSSYQGPDDCSTERLYLETRELLGMYADAPAKHKEAVRLHACHYRQELRYPGRCGGERPLAGTVSLTEYRDAWTTVAD
jgi:hypothetical protein